MSNFKEHQKVVLDARKRDVEERFYAALRARTELRDILAPLTLALSQRDQLEEIAEVCQDFMEAVDALRNAEEWVEVVEEFIG